MMMQGLSYASGPSQLPLLGMTVGAKFDQSCEQYADHDAVVSVAQGIRLTYRELQQQVDAFACHLLALGLEKGDRLGIWAPNCAEWAITQFAAFKAGIILVNLNPAYKDYELEYVLNKVSCKALVIATGFKKTDFQQVLTELIPELNAVATADASSAHTATATQHKIIQSARLPHLKHLIKIDSAAHAAIHRFSDLLSAPTAVQRQQLQTLAAALQFDDVINIQFTSGTTGSPKGTMLTHHNILNNAFFAAETMHFSQQDRVCIAVPLFHCFAMVIGNIACMTHGACMVYPSAVFHPLETLEAIEQEKCTAAYGVPTMFIAILEHEQFDQFDLSSLRTGVMGGSLCPGEIMQRVIDRMHMKDITICYGMTETSPICTQSLSSDSLERRVNTVGKIHPHLEVKIVDEQGQIVPRGQLGEFCVRGYAVMLGYWDDPEKTAEAIDQGRWMHTGDIAEMDAEGYVRIKGRIKDVVIRGGENLYPKEIEDFLYTHPSVSDVQVVGVPDPRFGEELCACIILHEQQQTDLEAIRLYCKERIASNKVPRYVHFLHEFPMTASGKAQKFKLREMMCDILNL
ncbi:fatty-acyl-CoA synthase [Acinetobacter calcoaceticus]|uniref:Fatty-acyl-CoA synthase n=1 Tax=Acinetobacter calcoaceticus TaxID=471 RepID=A0A4R1XR57_ACICA|nr:fatty-acyl-CoA synthase [Acinetobacter calcoaceticus]